MENADDIFKQMNRSSLAKEIELEEYDITKKDGREVDDFLEPRIVSQKEDVVYIRNPRKDWAFNRVLNFAGDNVSAITLCLQEQQAIAILLNKSSGAAPL